MNEKDNTAFWIGFGLALIICSIIFIAISFTLIF